MILTVQHIIPWHSILHNNVLCWNIWYCMHIFLDSTSYHKPSHICVIGMSQSPRDVVLGCEFLQFLMIFLRPRKVMTSHPYYKLRRDHRDYHPLCALEEPLRFPFKITDPSGVATIPLLRNIEMLYCPCTSNNHEQ